MDVVIKGRTISITVEDDGIFRATMDGDAYRDTTKRGLEEQLTRAMQQAKVKISVPFTQVDAEGGTFNSGTATGKHATQGRILVRWDSGRAAAIAVYEARSMLTPLTPPEKAELQSLLDAWTGARRELIDFRNHHRLDLAREVDRELNSKEEQK